MATKGRIIRAGIAGLGRTGWHNHALVFERLPRRYKVSAVLDVNKARMTEAQDRFRCAACNSFGELANHPDVDMVVVGLPQKLHCDCSIEALRAGKHVVCEKPMAMNLAEADRMIRVGRRAKGCFTIYQNRRYAHDFLKVREIVDSGVLGRVTLIKMCAQFFMRRWDWQTLRRNGGGQLNNTGPHFVDQALQFLGDRYPSEFFVDMQHTVTLGDADDHVKLVMKAPSAPVVEIELLSDCAYPGPLWLVTGTKGGLTSSASELRWKCVAESRLKHREIDERPTPDRSYNSEETPWSKERVWRAGKSAPDAQMRYYIELHDAIMKKEPPPVTPQSVRRQMKLIGECHRRCRI